MKKLMKIIGMKMVQVNEDESGGIVELTLVPKDMVKKKPMGIMDLAMGDISSIMQEVSNIKRFETKIYITFDEYIHEMRRVNDKKFNTYEVNKLTGEWIQSNVEFKLIELDKNEIGWAEKFLRKQLKPILNAM